MEENSYFLMSDFRTALESSILEIYNVLSLPYMQVYTRIFNDPKFREFFFKVYNDIRLTSSQYLELCSLLFLNTSREIYTKKREKVEVVPREYPLGLEGVSERKIHPTVLVRTTLHGTEYFDIIHKILEEELENNGLYAKPIDKLYSKGKTTKLARKVWFLPFLRFR